ncbi:RICIN domain-containing protein [Streptomyces sp. NPDC051994]|uniref:RICIN domain-containing protein n=1 Tax=unclassified Streptomyces TaxID=2593676 RepID=UPI003441B080
MSLATNHPPRHHAGARPRMLAALLATCCVALGIALSPSMTGTAHADGTCTNPIQCANFTSLSNNRALDVQNGSTGDGAFIVTNSAPGYHQSWRLSINPKDSSFTIVNNATGKCIDTGWPALRQQTCQGQSSQRWYLEPVAGAANSYLIRHEDDDQCLDLTASAQYDDAWTGLSVCHGGQNQQWTAPTGARNLAVDHAATRCQKDTSSCTWSVKNEAPAAPLPTVCASSVWFNNTSGTISQAFSVTNETGWSNTIGDTMSASFGTGNLPGVSANVTSQLSFQSTWSGSTSVNNSVTVPVPAKNYGWVTLSVLARKVTGTWTFDAHGFPWTADDTVTVPLKDDPSGGATMYIANTSASFSSCT